MDTNKRKQHQIFTQRIVLKVFIQYSNTMARTKTITKKKSIEHFRYMALTLSIGLVYVCKNMLNQPMSQPKIILSRTIYTSMSLSGESQWV